MERTENLIDAHINPEGGNYFIIKVAIVLYVEPAMKQFLVTLKS